MAVRPVHAAHAACCTGETLSPGLSLPLLIMRADLRPGGFPFSQAQLSKGLQWESHSMNTTLSFWIVL